MRFEFLRTYPANVLRYLPKFLAKDPSFKGVEDATSEEHEKQRQIAIDVYRQFWVDTATWGLVSWERIFRTRPPAGADYVVRRGLIKAKMLGTGTMTREQMELLTNQFVKGQDAFIREFVAPGVFEIVIPSELTSLSALEQALDEMKPAHLTYRILIERLLEMSGAGAIRYGLASVIQTHHKVGIARPKDAALSVRVALAVRVLSYHRFNIGRPKGSNMCEFVGYIPAIIVHRWIGGGY